MLKALEFLYISVRVMSKSILVSARLPESLRLRMCGSSVVLALLYGCEVVDRKLTPWLKIIVLHEIPVLHWRGREQRNTAQTQKVFWQAFSRAKRSNPVSSTCISQFIINLY